MDYILIHYVKEHYALTIKMKYQRALLHYVLQKKWKEGTMIVFGNG